MGVLDFKRGVAVSLRFHYYRIAQNITGNGFNYAVHGSVETFGNANKYRKAVDYKQVVVGNHIRIPQTFFFYVVFAVSKGYERAHKVFAVSKPVNVGIKYQIETVLVVVVILDYRTDIVKSGNCSNISIESFATLFA